MTPDTLKTLIEQYGDNWRAYYAAAEIAYFYEHGKLPEWAAFIDSIEEHARGDLIIHRDPENVH
jgi:hypothetical protein